MLPGILEDLQGVVAVNHARLEVELRHETHDRG
jgi:hypothetical protein